MVRPAIRRLHGNSTGAMVRGWMTVSPHGRRETDMKHGLVLVLEIMAVTLLLSGCAGLGAHPMGWSTHSMLHDIRGAHRMPSEQPCPDIPREHKSPNNSPVEGGDCSSETGAKRC